MEKSCRRRATGDTRTRTSPTVIISDISKIALDPIQFRYIYNFDITKQDLEITCLDDTSTTTPAATAIKAVTTAVIRSASTAMKAIIVAAAAWAGSSITATCAWSCSS